jgi:beta-galactosidase
MKKINFNDQWTCYRKNQKDNLFPVTLPHDAMQLDKRSSSSVAGVNTGWYEAEDYVYEKSFFLSEAHRGNTIIFEFEGVYHNATVYINGNKAAFHSYGYTGFYVEANPFIEYEKENTIVVDVKNSDQPNSRWYSGTGIYRPVWMYVLPQKHILLDGIKVTPLEYLSPKVQVDVTTNQEGMVTIEILDGEAQLCCIDTQSNGRVTQMIDMPGAKLWDDCNPNLYTCRVTFDGDIQETTFGIRVVECDSKKGFCINGKRVILRGACIHHDNGLLGACAYDFAEERKIRILKEAGYNAIRSAHNPCSKALLEACDRLGMLVMDEYIDVWYIHKTKYDYANMVEKNYKKDLKDMVDKDFNHPSVILYSTGNEVSETAQKKGIELCRKLTESLHELDPSRPVTCGVNIFFNFLSSMGFGVYSDKKAEAAVKDNKKKKAVGSEFFNTLAGFFGANFMKFGATLYPCDVKTRDSYTNMDIAGYNYGILRYKHDLKKYSNRIILGTETFCNDAYKFWEMAKKNPRLIGDFVWSGMDYLGEVGVGTWEYKEYAPDFSHGVGWVSAGSGRIDLTGKELSEMAYTRVAFELDKIRIGVIPVNNALDKHSPSAWKMTNAIESWSWNGLNGKLTKVEVYARAKRIDLFINGKIVGSKNVKNDCRAIFKTRYYDGEIKAIAYDETGNILAETLLKTAGDNTKLSLFPEQPTIKADGDLCYVRMQYTDEQNIVKPLERGNIKVTVEGGTLIGLGNACPYNERGYLTDTTDTYYGEALAIIKPLGSGKIVIRAKSKLGNSSTEVLVI